jgi:two-component system sensor histidine kinase CiaH
VRTKADHRLHAAKVAAIATAVVMVAYLIAVVVLNILVVHRLTGQADVRLSERLGDARKDVLSAPKKGPGTLHRDRDVDDAPSFVWLVSSTGAVTPLSSGAPPLPRRSWNSAPTTIDVSGTAFRFRASPSGSSWLVAEASVAQIQRVQNALLLPEILLGAAVLVLVYAGALVVGLRASAPLELVRQRQKEFTADASHELRTPLSVIEAEVELALSRPRDGEGYRDVLQRIGGEGQRLRRIVDDLLWLARVDEERQRVVTGEDVDIAATAESCVDRFQAVATARGVTLTFHRDGQDPALLHSNEAWIDRLIGVLVDNACRYAGDGGEADVRVRTTGARIAVDVDDSGPGIPEADRALVLDRFHRGVDDPGGTGLGLAIADSVVRATDGAWSIQTAPLGGARMEVSWRRGSSPRSGTRPGRLRRKPGEELSEALGEAVETGQQRRAAADSEVTAPLI